jgi:CubicO group peptidase (beta-lactamase class C family)
MHGYRGYQGTHFRTENHAFWKKHLCCPSPITLPRADAAKMGIDTTHYHKVWDVVWSKATDELHSLMVVKDGKVVYERYAPTLNAQTPKVLWSASKTFTSTAVGFAVDEGKLSVKDPVISFFTKEELPDTLDERLKRMTVKDLLTMSSGFSRDLLVDAITSFEGDWAQKALAVPMSREPGSKFAYNSMNTYLVSVIVSRAVGEPMDRYLDRKLFQPLGIKNWHWDHSPQGYPTGGWGLYLCTDDLAKAGQFYLQKGMWNGKQLLDPQWIIDSTSPQIYQKGVPVEDERGMGYGYQIWCDTHNAFRLDGAHGQHCIVMPEKDAVVAYHSNSRHTMDIIKYVWERIWPAL